MGFGLDKLVRLDMLNVKLTLDLIRAKERLAELEGYKCLQGCKQTVVPIMWICPKCKDIYPCEAAMKVLFRAYQLGRGGKNGNGDKPGETKT